MVNKNKVYFSAGDESKNKPLIICMMTLYKKSKSDLSKNGSFRTQMRVIPEKVSFKKREMEGLHLYGEDIFFIRVADIIDFDMMTCLNYTKALRHKDEAVVS
jgi:hypothetical protein